MCASVFMCQAAVAPRRYWGSPGLPVIPKQCSCSVWGRLCALRHVCLCGCVCVFAVERGFLFLPTSGVWVACFTQALCGVELC
jgi:hypothetical protein